MIPLTTNNERVSDSPSNLYAIILAQVVCFVNAFSGYIIARSAYQKPFEKFVSIVLGSMSFRIMIVGAVSWWCLSILGMPQLAYSLSLAIGVFVYLLQRSYTSTYCRTRLSREKKNRILISIRFTQSHIVEHEARFYSARYHITPFNATSTCR